MLHLSTERRWSAFLAVFLLAAGCDSEVVHEDGSGAGGSGGGGHGTRANGSGGNGADGTGGTGSGNAPGQGGSTGQTNPSGPISSSFAAGSPGYGDTVCVDHDELWASIYKSEGTTSSISSGGQGGFGTSASSGSGEGGFGTSVSSGSGEGGFGTSVASSGSGDGGFGTSVASSGSGEGGFGTSVASSGSGEGGFGSSGATGSAQSSGSGEGGFGSSGPSSGSGTTASAQSSSSGSGEGGFGTSSSSGGSNYPDACPTANEAAPYLEGFWTDVTGPVPGPPSQCCYDTYNPVSSGRPMFVEGKATRAAVGRGTTWTEGPIAIDVSSLTLSERAHIHEHFLAIARLEHASIASFAKFSLELLLVGAPADLLRDSQRAGMDEVEHAARSFEIAAAYGGIRSTPMPMPELANARPESSLLAIVRAAIAEGCVAETLGAFEVGEQAALADSPALRSTLETIADDESRHSALAWRFVRWAVDDGGVDAATVREAFASAIARHRADLPSSEPATSAADARAERHGLLSAARRSSLHREALARVERLAATMFGAD